MTPQMMTKEEEEEEEGLSFLSFSSPTASCRPAPRRPDSAHTTSLPEPSPLNRTGSINGLKKLQEISGNVPNSRLRSDSGTTPPFLCVVCGTCGRHMAGSASEEDDALGERRGGAAAPNGTSEHCPVQECAAHLTPLMLRRPAFKHMSLSDGAGCLSK